MGENKDEKIEDENSINQTEYSEKLVEEIKNFDNLTNTIQDELNIKDSKYYKERIKKLRKPTLIFIGFGLSYLFYLLSLESCSRGEGPCSTDFNWIKIKVIEEIISCVLMTIMTQLIILKIISKIHLIHIIIIFIIFYSFRHGMDFVDHGYFNFIFYLIIVGILNSLMLPLDLMLLCLKKDNNKIFVLLYFGLFFLLGVIIYNYLFNYKSNCSEWPKGLNNTFIDNNSTKYGCQIEFPKRCAFKVLDYIQDYTKIRGLDCQSLNTKKLKENILTNILSPYINEKTIRVGFPLTNKDSDCLNDFDGVDGNPLYEFVLKNLVDMDNKEILDKYFKDKIPEISVDFSDNDKGKLIIDVHFNKTLSVERKLLEKNSEPYSKNVLLLYIDSVSRANSLRKLKKTMKFFEKFMPYKGDFNKKYPSEIFHSFQFFKYHSFKGVTYLNYPLMFYGDKMDDQNNTRRPISYYFKQNGFVTCNVHDYCDLENTRNYHNYTTEEAFDHQYLSCDRNNDAININVIRCLYDKQNMEYFLEYIDQFWRKYKDNRKYASLFTNHGHEGTLNVIKYQDDIIANFLNRLFDDNLLKDTSIIFLSDHGVGMPSVYYLYDFYRTEIHLPSLYIFINDRKNISYEKQYVYIQENQQTLITGLDIYNTLGNIVYGDKYDNIPNKTLENDSFKNSLGISLFNRINAKERFPKKYSNYSSISEDICT